MKNILVTGGAGYIGSHTCLSLLEKGYQVFVMDSFINSSRNSLKKVLKVLEQKQKESLGHLHIFEGDIRDKNFIESIFDEALRKNFKIQGVIHFAALKSVQESILNPILYWDNNVTGTINLLDIMQQKDCNNIVFSSSAAIYGEKQKKIVDENVSTNPLNPYAFSKKVSEELLSNIFKSNPLKWKIFNLRYFNPIGAHSSGLIGESPKGIPNNIFPYITNVALGNFKEVSIFGKDWPTLDGTGVRDYIHVMDLAEAHIKALEFLDKTNSKFMNLNIGTGKGTSVLQLIKTFEAINKVIIPYKFVNRRDGDVSELIADNSLMKNILKWQPERSIEDMCKDGWNWQLNYPFGYD
tara:strand:+ start:2469 stop:3524 length:1056 start_codon:yes stop_codon:yes gene_type:complete